MEAPDLGLTTLLLLPAKRLVCTSVCMCRVVLWRWRALFGSNSESPATSNCYGCCHSVQIHPQARYLYLAPLEDGFPSRLFAFSASNANFAVIIPVDRTATLVFPIQSSHHFAPHSQHWRTLASIHKSTHSRSYTVYDNRIFDSMSVDVGSDFVPTRVGNVHPGEGEMPPVKSLIAGMQ